MFCLKRIHWGAGCVSDKCGQITSRVIMSNGKSHAWAARLRTLIIPPDFGDCWLGSEWQDQIYTLKAFWKQFQERGWRFKNTGREEVNLRKKDRFRSERRLFLKGSTALGKRRPEWVNKQQVEKRTMKEMQLMTFHDGRWDGGGVCLGQPSWKWAIPAAME